MPYFHKHSVNVLFIHIPKNGGTSIEYYLSQKYNIKLNKKSLYNFTKQKYPNFNNRISLQHQTLNTILTLHDVFNIVLNNLFIFCVVRNPYTRIISDLFFYKLITQETTQDEIYIVITKYLVNGDLDNHNIPQYKFIVDENDEIYKKVHILRFENLNESMKNINFIDFDNKVNVGTYNKQKEYFNEKSIKLINEFYEKDFILFNYEMM
jgi:hypothetical protein